jgi:hypothetical protein
MVAARIQDLPSTDRSGPFILLSVGPVHQDRIPRWRRNMSNGSSVPSSQAESSRHPRGGLDTLIYNNMWGRLCELFHGQTVTFDDHHHPEQSG